jgi:hypothetical protein
MVKIKKKKYVRLTRDIKKVIVNLYNQGSYNVDQLSKIWGTSKSSMFNIVKNKEEDKKERVKKVTQQGNETEIIEKGLKEYIIAHIDSVIYAQVMVLKDRIKEAEELLSTKIFQCNNACHRNFEDMKSELKDLEHRIRIDITEDFRTGFTSLINRGVVFTGEKPPTFWQRWFNRKKKNDCPRTSSRDK